MASIRSCAEWVANQERPGIDGVVLRAGDNAWLAGFLSGAAVATNVDVLSSTDGPSAVMWMTVYCRTNPASNTGVGGQLLFNALQRKVGR